jgi:hypothetical protein
MTESLDMEYTKRAELEAHRVVNTVSRRPVHRALCGPG